MITIQRLAVAGVHSLVRSAGPSAREAVVFVHGNPGSSEDWLHLLEVVSPFARVVAPDMPGYGKADRPARWPYTLQSYGAHLGALIDQLGIDRVHLVLHDLGGGWGLSWAAEHPTRVASITLFGVGILRGFRWHKYARIWQTPILGELSQLIVSRRLHHAGLDRENPRPFPRAFLDRMYDDADAGQKRAVLRFYRNTPDVTPFSHEAAAKLTPHHIPALVLWGAADPYVPARFAHDQADVFEVAGVHVLDGCGHWPMIDDPARCDALVLPFLRARVGAHG